MPLADACFPAHVRCAYASSDCEKLAHRTRDGRRNRDGTLTGNMLEVVETPQVISTLGTNVRIRRSRILTVRTVNSDLESERYMTTSRIEAVLDTSRSHVEASK